MIANHYLNRRYLLFLNFKIFKILLATLRLSELKKNVDYKINILFKRIILKKGGNK